MTRTLLALSLTALALPAAAGAQSSAQVQTKTDTSMKDGVPTTTRTVTSVRKHNTGRPRKVLGVKVGTKTHTTKVVRKTSVNANGDTATSVKTSH